MTRASLAPAGGADKRRSAPVRVGDETHRRRARPSPDTAARRPLGGRRRAPLSLDTKK
jgi:hypothetical protein